LDPRHQRRPRPRLPRLTPTPFRRQPDSSSAAGRPAGASPLLHSPRSGQRTPSSASDTREPAATPTHAGAVARPAPGHSGLPAPTARALAVALALVLPADCAGCGAWETAVCPACRELVSLTPVRSDRDAPVLTLPGDAGPLLPVWSLADYAG